MPDAAVRAAPRLPPCDHEPRLYNGPSREQVLALRERYYNPAVFTYYREPLMIVEGSMQYLWDETGKRYLDLFAGIVTVSCGHCHPKVTARAIEQLERLQHATTLYLHPEMAWLAERLARTLPRGLDCVYLVNSGTEANELAALIARLYTGCEDLIAVRNSYHGGGTTALGLTSHHTWKYPRQQGGPIHHAVCPDPYRSPFSGTPEEIAEKSAADIGELIRYSTPGRVAGFIAEPIQGVGGVTLGAPNYLGRAYEIVRAHGGLAIADEVQTGFGRTGNHYWGFENWRAVPDIVTTAKGLGNGVPIAAVVTRREIAEVLAQRIHFNTFAGNPVSAAAALAVLDVIEEDGLQRNAFDVGVRLKARLLELASRQPLIGDVRGMGLMLGVELVRDRESKEPATAETLEVLEAARELGLLLGKGGLYGNVLRIKPPMCLSAADADFALEVLELALGRAADASRAVE